MNHLIESVRRFPCLWDVDDAAYKDFEAMEVAWAKVAQAANFPEAKSAKVQWKKLRDNFREALKRQKDSKGRKIWRYQKQMEFLVPFMSGKWQDGKADSDKSTFLESEVHQHSEDRLQTLVYSMDDEANDTDNSFQRRRKTSIWDGGIFDKEDRELNRNGDEGDRELNRNGNKDKELNRNVIKPGNALLDFFSSMYNTTEELPAQLQLQVKRKIFEVVAEAEESALVLKQQQHDPQHFS